MKLIVRLAVVVIAFVAALPFIVLSAMGVMRPAEGFCIETGLARSGDAPTREEEERSFFTSPELADRSVRVAPFLTWPTCIRSRRGEHRFWAPVHDRQLSRLDEPNLRRAYEVGGSGILRVLTAPSFSRIPIAFRVEMSGDGTGTLHASWLEDDGQEFDETTDWEAYNAWRHAPLPRRSVQARLGPAHVTTIRRLLRDAGPYPEGGVLDGTWLVIESIHDGRRDVYTLLLSPPPSSSGRLFCALVQQAAIPKRALEEGEADVCDVGSH